MSAPRRIQLRRTKGWRKPDDAIVVARPSKWGNPYRVGDPATLYVDDGFSLEISLSPDLAVELYRELLKTRLWWEPTSHPDDIAYSKRWAEALEELRGRDLACWCPLEDGQGRRVPCHADVLLAVANPGWTP